MSGNLYGPLNAESSIASMLLEVRMAESRDVTQGWTRISWSGDPLVGRLKLMVTFGMLPSRSHCNTNRYHRELWRSHLLMRLFLTYLRHFSQLKSLFFQGIILIAFCVLDNDSIMLSDTQARDQESLPRTVCLHLKSLKNYFSLFMLQKIFLSQPSNCI